MKRTLEMIKADYEQADFLFTTYLGLSMSWSRRGNMLQAGYCLGRACDLRSNCSDASLAGFLFTSLKEALELQLIGA